MADGVIDCGEMLTIADVGDLYGRLLTSLAEGKSVSLDCSKIERIDTAALQIVLAYAKQLESQSAALSWLEPSDTFIKNASLLGLASELKLASN